MNNLVRFACPIADYSHAPGRSHTGCVMGSKKLKAIAVRGTKEVPIADTERFKTAVKEATDRIYSYPEGDRRKFIGSFLQVRDAAKAEVCPSRHFQKGGLPPDSDVWRLPESAQRYLVVEKGSSCPHCPYADFFGCDLTAEVKKGAYAGLKVAGVSWSFPGYEWGANVGIKSYPAIWKCRELCERYGMDQTTPISYAMELYQNNIIKKEDTDGLELDWGNEIAVHRLIDKIAHREGFGDILADGSVRAAQKVGNGAEKFLTTIKGMEVLIVDPRTATWAVSLGHIVSLRGGDDLDTTHSMRDERMLAWAREDGWSESQYFRWHYDWLDMPIDVKKQIFGSPSNLDFYRPDNLEGKAALVKWQGDLNSVTNSLGACLAATNYSHAFGTSYFAEIYSAYAGWEVTAAEIMKIGERIFNVMKGYIVREGLTRIDDDWPEKFYREPKQRGRLNGHVAPKEGLNRLLDEYYELRGWDKEKGVPTKKKLIELNLDDVADDLLRLGLIGE